mgnify:FL=1
MLKVDNLSYAYTDKYLFENLNLYLDIKTITKVSGSNGSGKTTFLKNISGILQDYEGEILYLNNNIKDISSPNIFYAGHKNGFKDNLTVEENLINDLRNPVFDLDKIKNYLSDFGCEVSFSTSLGNCSEGQKKKILLSLFASVKADLYVLDEPFSNLDDEGIDCLNKIFWQKTSEGSSIVFTSHENQGKSSQEINIDDFKND